MGKKSSRKIQKLLNSKAAATAQAELQRLEAKKAKGRASDFLSEDLKRELGIESAGDGTLGEGGGGVPGQVDSPVEGSADNVVITATNSEAKRLKRILQIKRRREERENAKLDKMSKKKLKKLKKLAEKKAKEAVRGDLYAGLEQNRLSDAHHALLTKSTAVGQRKTKRQRRREHELRVAAGIEQESEEEDGEAAPADEDMEQGLGHNQGQEGGDEKRSRLETESGSLDDIMGAIFSSKRQQAGNAFGAASGDGTGTAATVIGSRAGDAKRALNKINNPPAPRHQFGTSLAVPGFLNQFDHDDQADAAKVPPASDKPQTEEEKAAALAQKEARENALARHAAARAAKEAQQAAEDAAKVKAKIRTVRVLPAFNVAVKRDPSDPVQAARLKLPVCAMEQEIMEAVNYNDIVVLCGPTGSGKTTQVPQFLYEAGYGTDPSRPGMIAVTQPRRVAAMSVAKRVAVELGQPGLAGQGDGGKSRKKKKKRTAGAMERDDLSAVVAYQVRHDKATVRASTKVKFVTEGILLREAEEDILLRKYSVLVLDEVHERNTDTDILLAIVSRIVPLRAKLWEEQQARLKDPQNGDAAMNHPLADITPLKVIIMSATLNVQTLIHNKQLFGAMDEPPPVIQVEGRQFPVSVHFAKKTPSLETYLKRTVSKISKIHRKLPEGGVLVFLPGQQEITEVCSQLTARFGASAIQARKAARLKSKKRLARIHGTNGPVSVTEITANKLSGSSKADGSDDEDADSGADSTRSSDDEDEDEEEQNAALQNERAKEQTDSHPQNELNGEETAAAARVPTDTSIVSGSQGLDDDDEEDELGPMHILPLYGMLPRDQQLRVWQTPPQGSRLVVVATNVAESSITIPGIRYVVDSGRERQQRYHPVTGMSWFDVDWVSKASAKQRSGRAGRTAAGHCYRLYSSAVFETQFESFAPVELLNKPLEDVVVRVKKLGVESVQDFPFPTPPATSALRAAVRNLRRLGSLSSSHFFKTSNEKAVAALNKNGGDERERNVEDDVDEGRLTAIGLAAASYPVTVRFGKMLALGKELKCLALVVTLVAALSVRAPFLRVVDEKPTGEREKAKAIGVDGVVSVKHTSESSGAPVAENAEEDFDGEDADGGETHVRFLNIHQAHGKWANGESDALSVLNTLGAYLFNRKARARHHFCRMNNLRPQTMEEMASLRQQILSIVCDVEVGSGKSASSRKARNARLAALERETLEPPTPAQQAVLRQVLCAGFIDRVARLHGVVKGRPAYQSCDGSFDELLFLHPTSFVDARARKSDARGAPQFVVYQEVVRGTSRDYMRGVTVVEGDWLFGMAGGTVLCRNELRESPAPQYDPKADRVRAFVIPHFGDRDWVLPMQRVAFPSDTEQLRRRRVMWFARLLLEGKVISQPWKAMQPMLADSPKLLVTENTGVTFKGAQSKRAQDILRPMLMYEIDSLSTLGARWRADPKFLLAATLKWVRKGSGAERLVQEAWPAMVATVVGS